MKRKAFFVGLLLLSVLIFSSNNQQGDFPVLKGPYLGQKPPGEEPQLFMPGVVSTNNLDICISFLQDGKVCVFSNNENIIYFTYEKDGLWIKPEKAPFPDKKGKTQYTAGPDGQTLYFHSSRLTNSSDKRRDLNTWALKWTGSDWTEPYPLPAPANTDEYHEIYPSMTSNKTLYYFSGWKKDAPLGDTYRNKFINGKYQKTEKLEYPINSEYHEGDPFISPDGTYLIFASNRPGGYGFWDLYICFLRANGNWTHPINLGKKINSHLHVNTVCVTLDQKYFFFSSSRPTSIPKGKFITSPLHDRVGDIDLYWVGTGFIKDLKRIALRKKQAAPIIDNEYQKNSVQAAIKKLEELYLSGKDIYHFSISELLITCGHMIKKGKLKEAEKFYKALLKMVPDKFRIKQGYATVNILNGQTTKGINLLKKVWSEYPSAKSIQALEPIYSHLRFTKKPKDELTILKFITQEFSNSYLAFYDLASLFERTTKIELAINNCKKSLELKPGFNDAEKLLNKLNQKQKDEGWPVLKGPYLGQKPPGMTPEIFAPGIISTDKSEINSVFSPDGNEFYFSRWDPTKKIHVIMSTERISNIWNNPEPAHFSGTYSDADMCFSIDGYRFFFCSTRPLPGVDKPMDNYHIWFRTRTKNGWNNPQPVLCNNTPLKGLYPTLTEEGTIYFQGHYPGGHGKSDIYYCQFINGSYDAPINLGPTLNSKHSESDVLIAKDESYIIVTCHGHPQNIGKGDLYISFRRKDGSWTTLVNMGKSINTEHGEFCPMLSYDGKYFFFSRNKNDTCDVYWVDAKIIEELKPRELK